MVLAESVQYKLLITPASKNYLPYDTLCGLEPLLEEA